MAKATINFSITGITCGSCGNIILNLLKTVKENNTYIEKMFVDGDEHILTVELNNGDNVVEPISEDYISKLSKNIVEELDGIYGCKRIVNEVPKQVSEIDLRLVINEIVEEKKQQPQKEIKSEDETALDWETIAKGVLGIVWGITILTLMLVFPHIGGLAFLAMIISSSVVTLWLGWESYVDAFNKLYNLEDPNRNTLFAISTITIMISSFIPGLHLMLEAGLFIFGLMHISKLIESSLRKKLSISTSLEALAVKQVAKLDENNDVVNQYYPASALNPGDKIRVYSKQTIPIDGKCLSKNVAINDGVRSGNYFNHVGMSTGGEMIAGMIVPEYVPFIDIAVSKPVSLSHLAVEQEKNRLAKSVKAPIEKTIDVMLSYFVPAVLAFALFVGVAVLIYSGAALALACVALILVSACPCALSIIPSLAFKIGMAKASKHGVHYKSPEEMEKVKRVTAVVFDLNGTATTGEPKVTSYKFDNELITKNHFFACLSLIENDWEDAIAVAIRDYANAQKPDTDNMKMKFISRSHCGIKAKVNKEICLVGNEEFLIENNIEIPSYFDTLDAQHIIFFVKNNKVAGYLEIRDPIREHAEFVISGFKARGIEVHECTGSSRKTAEWNARKLGIPPENVCANVEKLRDIILISMSSEHVIEAREMQKLSNKYDDNPILINQDGKISIYGCKGNKWGITSLENTAFKKINFPELHECSILKSKHVTKEIYQEIINKKGHAPEANSKVAYINKLQNEGHCVLMVGDGVNDTGAMIAADCSFAVMSQSGAIQTQDLAGAVIENGNLLPILAAFDVADETVTNIKKSIGFSLAYNIVTALVFAGLLIGLSFVAPPAVGVGLMFLSIMCILAYQYVVKQNELPYVEELRKAQLGENENSSTFEYLLNCFNCFTPDPKPPVKVSQVVKNSEPEVISKIPRNVLSEENNYQEYTSLLTRVI